MLETSKSGASIPQVQGSAAPSPRGQRLWAVLLVLDSLFVIVFGGALAAKVYQHWQAPPQPVARVRRPVPAKPAPAPAPKPAETKAPEPPKQEAAKVELPKNGPVPKPSLLNEPPRHEAATLKGNKEPKAAKAEKVEKTETAPVGGKARPVEFHLAAPDARKVELYGAFIVRGNGRKKMARQSDGTWTLTLYLTPNTYKYHFLVDGKKTLDPGADKRGGNSVMTVGAQ